MAWKGAFGSGGRGEGGVGGGSGGVVVVGEGGRVGEWCEWGVPLVPVCCGCARFTHTCEGYPQQAHRHLIRLELVALCGTAQHGEGDHTVRSPSTSTSTVTTTITISACRERL